MSCYVSWNGRESVLASLLNQNKGEVVRDRVMSYLYSNEFKEKFGDFKDPYEPSSIPLDGIGQEPSYDWVEANVLDNKVSFALKSVSILQSDKAKQIFEKGEKNKWSLDKILAELQIPKEQKQLILDLGITDREQIALELASTHSYTVEINTAKEPTISKNIDYQTNGAFDEDGNFQSENTTFSINGYLYEKDKFKHIPFGYGKIKSEDGYIGNNQWETISEREYEEALERFKNKEGNERPTQHYSDLTVPGGTNYTENKIETPAIVPSIQGHAAWVKRDGTDNGIGWFRSDDKALGGKFTTHEKVDFDNIEFDDEGRPDFQGYMGSPTTTDIEGKATKTRRILEVQSDLFQKGRDKENLVSGNIKSVKTGDFRYKDTEGSLDLQLRSVNSEDLDLEWYNGKEWEPLDVESTFNRGEVELQRFKDFLLKELNIKKEDSTSNQFLQLLNKDNNWVTFFVKSIIQDSAKKGYEKVLFPSGNTASKVEGHTTLEEFKKQKEDRIAELERKTFKITKQLDGRYSRPGSKSFETEQEAIDFEKIINQVEITQLKQELERVEKEGFGALKPIYNFYENTVANVLKKVYGKDNVASVTDEYGNTWNEINLNSVSNLESIALSPSTTQWARTAPDGYEVSSQGDTRFSALSAKLKDGRTIEEAYQLDIKGYRVQGNDWKLGKGKPPLNPMSKEESWAAYKNLWSQYLQENPNLETDLREKSKGRVLTDKFATTDVSQARALAELLNEQTVPPLPIRDTPKVIDTTSIISRSDVRANPRTLYLFGDNDIREGLGGQAKEMRGEPNTVGISTKKLPKNTPDAFKTDSELAGNQKIITQDIDKAIEIWGSGNYDKVMIPPIGIGLAKLQEKAPLTWAHLQKELQRFRDVVNQKAENLVPPPPNSKPSFTKKDIFTVIPAQAADKKAIIKASIATQYIGFGEGIVNSSTELYRQQAGQYANTGNYSSNDIIFVSIGGKRGTEQQQKTQQDRTIKEALKAIEAGSTLITDNRDYIKSSTYNTGEKRLYSNLEAKGYNYSEVTIDGQLLGVWTKNNATAVPAPPSATPSGPTLLSLTAPEGTKRVRASERTSENIEAMRKMIQEKWVNEALANPDKQFKVGYENPNKNKYQDDFGFYIKEYAEYLDDIRLEMGEDFPKNLTFFPAFEFAMNSNPARLMKVFSSRIEELQGRKGELNIDPLVKAEIAAQMEVVVVDSNGTTVSYFTKDHGGNAQKEVTDTILSAMYTKYLSTTVPPSVDTLFEEGLKTIVRAQIEAKKKGDTKRENLWGDVRRSFAFKDSKVSFMSLMLSHFESLGFGIDAKSKSKLLSKYDKLKNDTAILEKVTEAVVQIDLVEGDYNLVLEESGDDVNFEQSRGTSLKDWSDAAFEQDPRTTAGARLKMWLSTQYRKQKANYKILDDSTGIPTPPGTIDITGKIPSMEWLTGLKLGQQLQVAFSLNGKQCSHKTLGPQIQEYFDTLHPTVPVLNSLGMQSLVQFDTLLASILDELSSTPDMTLELAISKLKGSGNSDLFETGSRLEKASERDQNEFLKVTNLQYVKGVVIKANPKKDNREQEFHQVRVIEAQQFGQRQTIIKKWKERNVLSAVIKKRADGSRTIDLDRTAKHVEAIKVIAMLNNIPKKEYIKGQTVAEKKEAEDLHQANMQVFLAGLESAIAANREFFSGITAQMLVEDELGKVLTDSKKRDFSMKRNLQGRVLQQLFREYGIDLNDETIQDLVGVYIKPGRGNEKATISDKVSEWTKGTKLQGDWLSQFSFSLEGKPKGMFSAFFGKAAGLFTDKDIDTSDEEIEDQVMENNPLMTENTTMNALANVARKHTPNLHTNSHRNAENKTVWDYSLNTALSNEVQRFVNNSEEMRKVYFKTHLLSYQDAAGNIVSGNWHLNKLLENKDKFGITFLEGLNYNNRSKGTTRTGMSDREQLLSIAGAYFNEGRPYANMVSLTHSDKTVTPIYTGVPKIQVSEVANSGVIGLNVQEAFYEVFMAEYRRALNIQSTLRNGGTTGDAQLDKGGTKFFFLPLFNKEHMATIGTKEMLYAEDDSLLEDISGNKPLFLELIANFLRDEIKKESEKWAEVGIEYKHLDRTYQKAMQDELDNVKGFGKLTDLTFRKQNTKIEERNQVILNNAIKEFTLNTLLWNMNSTMLFTGDPAQNWKPSKVSTATESDHINGTFAEFAKRLAKDIAPGQTLNFTKPTFRTLTISDVKETYDYITKFGGNIESSNAGDAQEFTTVQEHLDVMLASGLIERDLYNELSGIVSKGGDYKFTDEQLDRMMQPMQAMKPVYTGFREPANGFRIYDYIKTSSYPLLPQLTKGLEIDKVRQMVEQKNIQRVVLESGRKMGGPTKKVELFKVDKDGVVLFTNPDDATLEASVQTLDRKNFRIQQDVPYDRDKEAIKIVSQMNKLIVESIGGLTNFDIEGFGNGKTGKQVRKYKEDIKRKMIEYNLKTLKEKLGMKTDEFGNTSPLDRKRILNLIIEEAKSRGYSTNDIVLIERLVEHKDDSGLIVDTDFDFPLFLHPAVEKFESLLMSIVRKVTEFKMPGKSYVQAASVGYNRVLKEDEVDSRNIIYVGGYDSSKPLRHMEVVDGVVKPAQVLAPFNFYSTDADGNEIKHKVTEFLKEGTNELDLDKVPAEFLQLIGARIPNQGHNSMIAMEIVGFVPDWMGDTLIVPSAITGQMGSDFDVDKLFTYKRPYTLDGVVKRAKKQSKKDFTDEYVNNIIESTPEGETPRDVTTAEIDAEYAKLPETKESLQDAYFNIHWGVLTNRDLYAKVLSSLDKPDLSQANKKFATNSNNRGSFWSSRTQQEMFQGGKDAKTLVGLTSLAVTFNSVIQDKALQYGYYTKTKEGFKQDTKHLKLDGKEFSMLSGTGTVIRDGVMYSKHDNQTIFQSGAVDNAKDRTLDNLNIGIATYPAIQVLHQMETNDGEILTTDFSTAMMVQEILWEYSKEMRQGNDSMSEGYSKDLSLQVQEKLYSKYATEYYELTQKNPEPGTISLTTEWLTKAWDTKNKATKVDTTRKADMKRETYLLTQLATLKVFGDLLVIGERLGQLQKTLNQDTNGAGPNVLYADQQMENFTNISIPNQFKVIINEESILDTGDQISEQADTFLKVIPLAINLGEKVFPLELMRKLIKQIGLNSNTQLSEM